MRPYELEVYTSAYVFNVIAGERALRPVQPARAHVL